MTNGMSDTETDLLTYGIMLPIISIGSIATAIVNNHKTKDLKYTNMPICRMSFLKPPTASYIIENTSTKVIFQFIDK